MPNQKASATRPVVVNGVATAAAPAEARYTLVEFFAGGGLARLGFGNAWDVVLANDMCAKKAKAYRANFGAADFVGGDVAKLRAADIPFSDVWWASFPCTDHSTAGLQKGFHGVHGSAVFALLKRLQALKRVGRAPGVLAFENVVGFMGGDGEDFRLLAAQIATCGYRLGGVVVDAEHWLPQGRRRIFLVAVQADVPLPSGLALPKADQRWHPPFFRKAVKTWQEQGGEWTWWTLPEPAPRTTTLADIVEPADTVEWFGQEAEVRLLALLDEPGRARLAEMRAAGHPVIGTMVERTHPVLGERVASIRADTAFTLMATATGTSRQRLIEVNDQDIRVREYTPRELARLMGVPETYSPPTKLVPAMKVMGDAVAVPAVRHLVCGLIEPLVDACRASRGNESISRPEDGRRSIKDKTVGMLTYLLPGEHLRIKRLAGAQGLSLSRWVLTAINAALVNAGEAPLQLYEASPRDGRSKTKGQPAQKTRLAEAA